MARDLEFPIKIPTDDAMASFERVKAGAKGVSTAVSTVGGTLFGALGGALAMGTGIFKNAAAEGTGGLTSQLSNYVGSALFGGGMAPGLQEVAALDQAQAQVTGLARDFAVQGRPLTPEQLKTLVGETQRRLLPGVHAAQDVADATADLFGEQQAARNRNRDAAISAALQDDRLIEKIADAIRQGFERVDRGGHFFGGGR